MTAWEGNRKTASTTCTHSSRLFFEARPIRVQGKKSCRFTTHHPVYSSMYIRSFFTPFLPRHESAMSSHESSCWCRNRLLHSGIVVRIRTPVKVSLPLKFPHFRGLKSDIPRPKKEQLSFKSDIYRKKKRRKTHLLRFESPTLIYGHQLELHQLDYRDADMLPTQAHTS